MVDECAEPYFALDLQVERPVLRRNGCPGYTSGM